MRIIFDLRKVGLGNNGGSQTLVKSGNVLKALGHTVTFIDSQQNQYTWDKLECKHLIVRHDFQIPSADIIIATGYKSVGPTVLTPDRCGVKCHWIRAWETWQYSEQDIVKKILSQPTKKIVNSICLQNKLNEYSVQSDIIRPGYDFDIFFPVGERQYDKTCVLGALFREGIHGNRKRTSWVFEAVKRIKKIKKVKLYMFGSEKDPNLPIIDKYVRLPTLEEKNLLYNSIDIWLSPTMSEGLHIPPGEAMLTKCCVVGTTAPLSGLQDYLIDKRTGIVTQNYLSNFIYGGSNLINKPGLRKKLGEEGRIKILSMGDRKDNMMKLISLLEGFIK
jgi:hypothetical protein